MGVLFGVLGVLVPVAVLGGIGTLVFLVRGGQRGGDALTSRTLLRGYLRFASMAGLVIFLIGASLTLTAAFAAAFGHDFSYPSFNGPVAVCGPLPPSNAPPGAPQQYRGCPEGPGQVRKDSRQADNLISGISLLVAGLVIGAGHRAGLVAIETPQERADSALARTERVVGTGGFGLVILVAVPMATYLVMRFVVLGSQADPGSGPPDPPGGALATALVFLVAWGCYLVALIRRRGGPAPAERVVPATG
ncbi:MAG: hypothetical protein NVSMB29_04750 [Candidatus Dormibacteria bacterium]